MNWYLVASSEKRVFWEEKNIYLVHAECGNKAKKIVADLDKNSSIFIIATIYDGIYLRFDEVEKIIEYGKLYRLSHYTQEI